MEGSTNFIIYNKISKFEPICKRNTNEIQQNANVEKYVDKFNKLIN